MTQKKGRELVLATIGSMQPSVGALPEPDASKGWCYDTIRVHGDPARPMHVLEGCRHASSRQVIFMPKDGGGTDNRIRCHVSSRLVQECMFIFVELRNVHKQDCLLVAILRLQYYIMTFHDH